MSKKPEYIPIEIYRAVREECQQYYTRQKAIKSNEDKPSLSAAYREANRANDVCFSEIFGDQTRFAEDIRQDIALGRGWCKSDSCLYANRKLYDKMKRRVIFRLALSLGFSL